MSNVPHTTAPMIRVGVIVPQSNTTNEVEFNRLAPQGLSFHFARIPLHHENTDRDSHLRELIQDLAVASVHLGSCDCDLIVFGCTSDSMTFGDEALVPVISEASGVGAITTATAITSTLKDLGVTRIAMASPYTAETNDREAGFLQRAGFSVVATAGLSLNTSLKQIQKMSRVTPNEVYELALSVDCADAEALLICCTDFNTLDVIKKLEIQIQKPVVSSNVATFATATRQLGVAAGQDAFGQVIAALSRP
jgi:arylmalonate decarboxylase